jgi:alkane 1-monooxygenase
VTHIAPYFAVFVLPLWVAAGILLGGYWSFAGVAFIFGMIPVLDGVLGLETSNRAEAEHRSGWWDLPLVAYVPVHVLWLAWVVHFVATRDLASHELVGTIVSTGTVCGGAGINVAHELMHRKERWARALSELLMVTVSYPHFCIEHVHGHHRHVATPNDAAFPRFGETVFRFVPRSIYRGLVGAWSIETARSRRRRLGAFSVRDARNRHPLALIVMHASVWWLGGPGAALSLLAIGAVGVVLLEIINYVEHYGLERRPEGGRYERVRPQHSWNSSHKISNWFLFNLARHSDHHASASRSYDRLRHHEGVPQLPAGYGTMVVVAVCPPLWFWMMNDRSQRWRDEADLLSDLGA